MNARLDDPADETLDSVERDEDAEYLAYLDWRYDCWDDADDGREEAA